MTFRAREGYWVTAWAKRAKKNLVVIAVLTLTEVPFEGLEGFDKISK